MATVIVFYVPAAYHTQAKYVPLILRGKVLRFIKKAKRSA